MKPWNEIRPVDHPDMWDKLYLFSISYYHHHHEIEGDHDIRKYIKEYKQFIGDQNYKRIYNENRDRSLEQLKYNIEYCISKNKK